MIKQRIDIIEGNDIAILNNRSDERSVPIVKGNVVSIKYNEEFCGYDILLDTGYEIFIECSKVSK